jgi:hypothetical protein
MIEGTAELQAHRLQVKAVNPSLTGLVFDRVQSQIPIRFTAATLASSNLHLQAQTVRWQPDKDTTIASPMDLHSTLHIHLQRQQIDAENLVIDLSTLGRLHGSGAWQWTTKTAQEVHLALVPTSVETVWPYVAPLLPAPYATWQVTGLTQIELYTPSLAWDDGMSTQPLTLDWRFNHIAFSSAEGDVAGEHINGQIQADLSLTPNWYPASIRASLHLKPFALLVGSFFPEFENNHIEFNLTLNSTYHSKTNHIDLNIDGHFGPLGQMKIQGRLDPSSAPLQVDVTCTLSQINMRTAWQTFMPEALRQATDPPAMEGLLNTHLQLSGTQANAHVRGDLQLAASHLQMGSFNLRNLTLQLPIDVRYPLPQHLPDLAELPASAYGRLQVGDLQLNGLQIPGITTKLALRSDSVIFQKDIQASLLKGVLHIQNLAAYHVLQPQRQLLMQMRLRALHLKDLQRRNDTLPIAGQIDADFSS